MNMEHMTGVCIYLMRDYMTTCAPNPYKKPKVNFDFGNFWNQQIASRSAMCLLFLHMIFDLIAMRNNKHLSFLLTSWAAS